MTWCAPKKRQGHQPVGAAVLRCKENWKQKHAGDQRWPWGWQTLAPIWNWAPKDLEGSSGPSAFSRTGSVSSAQSRKDCREETPWNTLQAFSHKELFFPLLRSLSWNSPDPRGFPASCAKMKPCEGRRLSHSHCSPSPSVSGGHSGLHPTTQEIERNGINDPRSGWKDQVRQAKDEMTNTKRHWDNCYWNGGII